MGEGKHFSAPCPRGGSLQSKQCPVQGPGGQMRPVACSRLSGGQSVPRRPALHTSGTAVDIHIYCISTVHIAIVLSKYLFLRRSICIDRQSMFCKLSFSVTMSGQSAQPCTVCSYRVHYITTINHRKCHVSPNNVVLLVEFVIELERMIRDKEKGK